MSGARPWRQQVKPRITPDDEDAKFSAFTGVVNTHSRKDIGRKALYVGDNVAISDTGKITRRDGYTAYRSSGTVRAAYGGAGPLYVVDGDTLLRLASQTDARTLTTGLANAPYCWDTLNGDAYFVNGTDAGIARGDAYLPWRLTVPTITTATADPVTNVTPYNMGESYNTATFRLCATYETSDGRETAPSEVVTLYAHPNTSIIRCTVPLGYVRTNLYCTAADDTVFRKVATSTTTTGFTFNPARGTTALTTLGTSSIPAGITHIAFCKGQCFAGAYLPSARMSAVWISQPFAPHLFNVSKDYLPVSGRLALLLWNNKGVLIGTDEAIYQYDDSTGELELLVNYGVVPGLPGDLDAQSVAYFWTTRGICRAMPFENLTEKDVSMPPGSRVSAGMVYLNGMQQFIAVTQGGGEPFNSRKERT